MRIIVAHDFDCPLGMNGLRAYVEARDALSSMPPETRATEKDRAEIAQAELDLERKQVCICGVSLVDELLGLPNLRTVLTEALKLLDAREFGDGQGNV